MTVIPVSPSRHIVNLLGGLIYCFAAATAFAQDPLPVQVTFQFNNVSVPLAQPDRKTLESQIGGQLAKSLQSQFSFWTFKEGAEAGQPQLKVQLQKSDGITIVLAFVSGAGVTVKEWSADVFKSVDLELRPLPRPNQWPKEITDVFTTKVVIPNQQEILEKLKPQVPVGRELAIIKPSADATGLPFAVLPLNWDTHQDIAECQFLLRFDRVGGGKVTIQSTGLGNSAQYTPDHPQYAGIAVQLEKWQQGGIEESITTHIGDLLSLKPVEFYLKNEKLPGAAPQ
jgi:hypothetical protein